MEQSKELDNQQERREADLNWLAGFFDGEGSLSILRSQAKCGMFGVQARITQSSQEAMDEIKRILQEHEVPVFIYSTQPKKVGKKRIFYAVVLGLKRVQRFVALIYPYLRMKKKDAEIVIRFVESRIARGKRAPYSEEEIDCYIGLRDLHGYNLRESSETIRKALLGRYSPNSERKPETAAEMTAAAS